MTNFAIVQHRARRAFMAECDRVYRESQERQHGTPQRQLKHARRALELVTANAVHTRCCDVSISTEALGEARMALALIVDGDRRG